MNKIPDISRIHITPMGAARICRNMNLSPETDLLAWCRKKIADAEITQHGKNLYARTPDCIFTIHATAQTIITAHPVKK